MPKAGIRDLLSFSEGPNQSYGAVDAIARAQLAAVDGRIARLDALKAEPERMVVQCVGGSIRDCRVIAALGDHGQCAKPHHDPRETA